MATSAQISSLKASASKIQSNLNAAVKSGAIKNNSGSGLKANSAGYSTTDSSGNTTYYKSAKDAPGYNDTFQGKGTTSAGNAMYTKDSAGNVITPSSMSSAVPVTLPSAPIQKVPDFTANNSTLAGADSGLTANPDGTLTVNPATDLSSTNQDNAFATYIKSLNETVAPTGESIRAKLEKDTGLRQKQQDVNNYSAQLNTITANRDAEMIGLEGQGRGITESIIGGQQAQISREAAIKALPVQAQLAAAQGNLQLAQDHINTWGQILMTDATNQYNRKSAIITATYNYATEKEKTRLTDLKAANERTYQEKQALSTAKMSAMSQALGQGAPASVRTAIENATTREGVIAATGIYNGDLLAQEAQRANIAQSRASTAASYDAITDRKERLKLAQNEVVAAKQLKDATDSEVKSAKGDKALGVLASVNELMNHPGFGSAVGPNPLARMEYGLGTGIFKGLFSGNKSEFKSEVDRLANTLTLENMSLLKGPATDKDVEIIANSMSRLKNMDVSEASYTKELQRLYDASNRIVQTVGVTPEQVTYYGITDKQQVKDAEDLWSGTSQSTPMVLGNQTY